MRRSIGGVGQGIRATWERLEGGVVGLLVGDALGVPYEFHAADALPPRAELEMDPPEGFRRAHHGVPPGTWSDDGAQALCLLASLLDRGELDPDDVGRRLLAWYREGYLAVDGQVFDVGVQTAAALQALGRGVPAREAGPRDARANGNGSLMRVLPLALFHALGRRPGERDAEADDAALVRDAHAQSAVTHGHPRAEACCALYCLWATRELSAAPRPVGDAFDGAAAALRSLYAASYPVHLAELDRHILALEPGAGRGSGYVVDCLASARRACAEPTYEGIVRAAIALGDDTDTTACVAGGIGGIRHGKAGIPPRWRERLRGSELVAPLLAGLAARLASRAAAEVGEDGAGERI